MRRTAVLFTLLSCASCHRTQPAPVAQTVVDAGPPAALTAAALDSADASALSGSTDTTAQIEPHLAVAPDGAVAIAWMGVRAGKPTIIGVRFSPDGGDTWDPVQTIASPDGRWAADPVLAADAKGTFYLAWLGFRRDASGGEARDTHVYVARAEPGTGRFGAPVSVTDRVRRGTSVDKPWIAVTAAGTVLVTWAHKNPLGNGVGIARSADGVTWGDPGVVIERVGLQARLPYICASQRGERVWIAYLDSDAGVRLRASEDSGASWSSSRVTTVSALEEKDRIALDSPVCAGDGDDVAVAFGRTHDPLDDARSPALDAIALARSYDGGRTFDWRRTIDVGPGLAMHPQIVREADGAIDLAWYAGGAGAAGGTLRWARAEAGGAPTAARAAREGLRFAQARKDATWPGDYFGFGADGGKLFFASIDADGDVPHVAFTKIAAR